MVFDCSARYQGTCLNDHLLQGPDLINNLAGIIMRLRQHPIVLMCDVEKMFHQFHVKESDRNYLCFFWWKDGNLNDNLQEFHIKVHLFGATSSPGCDNLYPLGSQFVMRNFYVDDGVTSVETVEEGIKLAKEARKLCAMGGLRLHKFVSNSRAVMESIPPSERATDARNRDLPFDGLPLERALGIKWQRESDVFKFQVELKTQPDTSRGILSTVASIYDPLGFISPVLLNGKRILQDLCQHGIGWDDPDGRT